MNKLFKTFVISAVFIFSFSYLSFSQKIKSLELPPLLQQKIEDILENSETGEIDALALQNNLYGYLEFPLDINKASREELNELILLNDMQILQLKKHIADNGPLLEKYELQAVEGFDLATIQAILPFITIAGNNGLKEELQGRISQEAVVTYRRLLEKQEGFSVNIDESRRYLGDPNYLSFRYNVKTRRLSAGFVAEKDAGEQLINPKNKVGVDYLSGYVFAKNIGIFKRVALGDYKLEFGQGLSVWTSRAFGKTADIYSVKRNTNTIDPFRSIDGNPFMRGAAAMIRNNKWEITPFISYNSYDATVNNVETDSSIFGLDNDIQFSSFYSNGFHRTEAELNKKNNVNILHAGVIPKYKFNSGSVSLLAANRTILNGTFTPRIDKFNTFAVDSTKNSTQLALSYDYIWKNILFFGEASRNLNGGLGLIQGAIISLDPKLNLIFHYRDYARNFISFVSNPIREVSNTSERGLYTGLELQITKGISFSGYYDYFNNTWPTRSNYGVNGGYEYLAQLNFIKSKKTTFYIRYREEQKRRNNNISNFANSDLQTRRNLRFHLQTKPSETFVLKTRIEFSDFNFLEDISKGVLLYQDLNFSPLNSNFSYTFRYALFDTDDFNSRIYAYENDVLYSFSVPAYYSKGSRVYGMINCRIGRNIKLQVRLSQTLYEDRNTIGSGLTEIQDNSRTDLRTVLKIKF